MTLIMIIIYWLHDLMYQMSESLKRVDKAIPEVSYTESSEHQGVSHGLYIHIIVKTTMFALLHMSQSLSEWKQRAEHCLKIILNEN